MYSLLVRKYHDVVYYAERLVCDNNYYVSWVQVTQFLYK